jgi:hypothetical protein
VTIQLGWTEARPPDPSPTPIVGSAAFHGRYAAAFDVEFSFIRARSFDAL